MAIHELNKEQIRDWSLEQKDRWWLDNVFRGDMPQLTLRSAATGMILGGVLSLTNLYIGAKTGWTLGVGITSVILAFALFKVFAKSGMANEFTVLENNAMQSIATAAGYMTSPMISSLAALMLIQNQLVPLWQTMAWIIALAILGVLFAFPFKRRFINDEQQPFPEGRAAGVVMDSLHHGDPVSGMLKAKLLIIFSGLAALVKFCQSETITSALSRVFGWFLHIPEFLDEWLYRLMGWTPTIQGTPVTSLTLRPELDLPMLGAGGLMGIRVGVSLLLGAAVNYALLAPFAIEAGEIVPNARGTIGFREITFWSLWCGVAMMTVASLIAFFAKPDIILGAFRKMFNGKKREQYGASNSTEHVQTEEDYYRQRTNQQGAAVPSDQIRTSEDHYRQMMKAEAGVLDNIELPLRVSLIGIPIIGALVVWMANSFFGVHPFFAALAVVLVFFFSLIAINSTGLTAITPIGAMGKLTQLTYGVLAPGDKSTNLVTAGITGEVASHSANLLMDIKPGYMLGAKPRQQAMGHVLGVIAGAILSVPVFYLVFIRDGNTNLTTDQVFAADAVKMQNELNFGEGNPMPAATVWRSVADVLAEGVSNIPVSARWAALAGIIIGIVFEVARMGTKNRFPLSAVGIGLGFIIPFNTCLTMFLGSFIFWIFEKRAESPDNTISQVVKDNQEPICAGLIAGGALMGIVVAVVEVFFLS
ncbi:MAG: OPT/YSL family transporter [Gemmataceae bacterium]|nr:OPT/YSL family transporter [Gemmataceae bacterium]